MMPDQSISQKRVIKGGFSNIEKSTFIITGALQNGTKLNFPLQVLIKEPSPTK